MVLYKGFSTLGGEFTSTKLTDRDLIKRDLLNHFAIRKGEKVGNPGFGSGVLDLVFEPLTEEVKSLLLEEIQAVINNDPRVALQELLVDEFENGIQAQVSLLYVLDDQVETMIINFDRQDGTIS
jgi:phage baseplate assembly protein W